MSSEVLSFLAASLPDKVVHNEYTDERFWIEGTYRSYSTDTVSFLPIGEDFISWVWEATQRDKLQLARELCSILAIPKDATPAQLLKHAFNRPREMYGMRGTIAYCLKLDPSDPMYLSEAGRLQMVEFAKTHPYLIDVLMNNSNEDFLLGDRLAISQEDMNQLTFPGQRFTYWDTYFPEIRDLLYEQIERNERHEVVSYRLKPYSEEFLLLRPQDRRS